nr:MAG TPA: hypothetical protein [Caudoviricetes sp.]
MLFYWIICLKPHLQNLKDCKRKSKRGCYNAPCKAIKRSLL